MNVAGDRPPDCVRLLRMSGRRAVGPDGRTVSVVAVAQFRQPPSEDFGSKKARVRVVPECRLGSS